MVQSFQVASFRYNVSTWSKYLTLVQAHSKKLHDKELRSIPIRIRCSILLNYGKLLTLPESSMDMKYIVTENVEENKNTFLEDSVAAQESKDDASRERLMLLFCLRTLTQPWRRNVMINKLRAKQCCRYIQPSNEDEFEFSDSPPTSINKRTRSRATEYRTASYSIVEYLHSISEYLTSIYRVTRRALTP